ncbi:unnamed protein product [Rangifer tarandus platyrhynchus]|uniref:Uncharacterized protein n=2 Tax=Rangifer tarandus platyrhynchus TaxID=3082113 RepID=A0AC59ZN12_RANTA|nr:unnamed protein product [Rangifer tarandus platyrhynchus]
MTVDLDLGHLTKAVFVSSLHCRGTLMVHPFLTFKLKKKNLVLRTRLHCLCNQVDALCRCSLEGLTGLAVCSALQLSKQRQTYSGAVCPKTAAPVMNTGRSPH